MIIPEKELAWSLYDLKRISFLWHGNDASITSLFYTY